MYECMWCVNIVLTKQYFLLYWEKTSWWRDLLLQKNKFFKRTYVFFVRWFWMNIYYGSKSTSWLCQLFEGTPNKKIFSIEKLRNWKRKSPPVCIYYGSKSNSWLCLYEGTPNEKYLSRETKRMKEIIFPCEYLLWKQE